MLCKSAFVLRKSKLVIRKSDFAWCVNPISHVAEIDSTRPDTRLPLSYAGGQGQCFRSSLEHLGRSSRLKKLRNTEKVIVAEMLDGQRYPCPALVGCA